VEAERERDEARAALAAQRRRADSLARAYLQEQGDNDKLRVEIAACRNQVEPDRALGVSLHKAANKGAQAERAAVVAWLEKAGWMPSMVEVFKRGEHRREETE
jgi:inorganic triphosphatase YgiF